MYQTVLGSAWLALPAVIRAAHSPGDISGTMSITWGSGWFARLVARAFRFPEPGAAVSVRLSIEEREGRSRWTRRMGRALLVTEQWSESGLVFEELGPVLCGFRLQADAQSLWYTQEYAGLCWGRLRLKLPCWFWPRVSARVSLVGDHAHSEVTIVAPWLGRVLRYEGLVKHVSALREGEP